MAPPLDPRLLLSLLDLFLVPLVIRFQSISTCREGVSEFSNFSTEILTTEAATDGGNHTTQPLNQKSQIRSPAGDTKSQNTNTSHPSSYTSLCAQYPEATVQVAQKHNGN